MALQTVTTFQLDGVTREFTIPFEYLTRKFVVLTLLGPSDTRKVLVLNVDFRFVTPTKVSTTVAWGPGDGYDTIELRRVTSATERLVNFADGSILRSYDLNISQVQAIHIAEEGRDVSSLSMLNNTLTWDALNLRIRKVADPISAQDAATKNYVDNQDAGQLAYIETQLTRTLRGPQGQAIALLPNAVARANMVLAFNGAGDPIMVQSGSGTAIDLEVALKDPSSVIRGAAMVAAPSRVGFDTSTLYARLACLPIYVNNWGIVGDGIYDDAIAFRKVVDYLKTLPASYARPKIMWVGTAYWKTEVDFTGTNVKEFGGEFSPAGGTVGDRTNGSSIINLTKWTQGPGTVALTLPNGFNGGSFMMIGSGDYKKDPVGLYIPNMLPCQTALITFRDLHNWNYLAERCSDPRIVQIRSSTGGAAINRKDTAAMLFSLTGVNLTSNTAVFDAGDVGREFCVAAPSTGNGTGGHVSKIATVISPTSATIVDSAPAVSTNVRGCFGLIQCSTTNGSNVVVFERSWMTAADVGRFVCLDGAGAARIPIWSRITTVDPDGKTCTIRDNATLTSSIVQLWIGAIGIMPNQSNYPLSPNLAPNGYTIIDCVVENSNGPAWVLYGRAAEMIGNIKAYVNQGYCASAALVWNPTDARITMNCTGGGRRHTKIVGTSSKARFHMRSGLIPTGDCRPFLLDMNGSANELVLVPPSGMALELPTLFEVTAASATSGFGSGCLRIEYQAMADTSSLRRYWRKGDMRNIFRERYAFNAANGYVIDNIAPALGFDKTPLAELIPGIHIHMIRMLLVTSQYTAATSITNHWKLVISSTATTGDLEFPMYPGTPAWTEEGANAAGKSLYTYLPNLPRFGRTTFSLVAVGTPPALTDIKFEAWMMFD